MVFNEGYKKVSIVFCILICISTACSSLAQSGAGDEPATQTALLATYTELQAREQNELPQSPTEEPVFEVDETEVK